MIIINGQFESLLDVRDRGFQYGDGCFTTLRFKSGCLQLWPFHLSRLQDNCKRLAIDFDQWTTLKPSADTLIKQAKLESGVIKIMITRGRGGRGYSPKDVIQPSSVISIHALPDHYEKWQETGITLGLSPIKLAVQPLLAGIKHCNRLEQVLVKKALDETDFEDVLVCDTQNYIIESSAGNVFWFSQGQWFTPSLVTSGVEGVMRNFICQLLTSKKQKVIEIQQKLTLDFIPEEMFICNALMQVVAVKGVLSDVLALNLQFSCERVRQLQKQLATSQIT